MTKIKEPTIQELLRTEAEITRTSWWLEAADYIDELEARVERQDDMIASDSRDMIAMTKKVARLEAHQQAGRELAKRYDDGDFEDYEVLAHLEGDSND